jgi:lipopolysaccharide transport system permease protein
VLSGLVDFCITFVVLIGLLAFYGIAPTPAIALLPLFLLLAMITALGFGLWLSALNVRYRDVNHLVPFLVRSWMYLTPVVYGSTLIPDRFRFLLSLNPMTGVVEGFRWALLGHHLAEARPPDLLVVLSVVIALGVLVSGLWYYRRTQDSFADII